MGAFFTNIQVKSGGLDSMLDLKELMIVIMRRDDYEKVEEPSDRAIIISGDITSEWITVYDELSDSDDYQSLEDMASAISQALGTYAVSNLVYDSDLLCMRLFEQGKSLDLYVNDVELYNGFLQQNRKRNGQLSRWVPLLKEVKKSDLSLIWQEESLFAEDKLHSLSKCFGWLTADCCTGYNYRQKDELDPRDTILYFRNNNPIEPLFNEDGPTKFEYGVFGLVWECKSNIRFSQRFFHQNTGVSERGFSIRLWGSAIDEGIIDSLIVDILLQDQTLNKGNLREVQLKYANQKVAVPGFIIDFPDYDIPAGAELIRQISSKKDIEKAVEMNHKSQTTFDLSFIPLKSGIYEIFVSIYPTSNIMNGVEHKIPIYVDTLQLE